MHFFRRVPFRQNAPTLDPVTVEFFGGVVDAIRSELHPAPNEPAPSMKLVKNVYKLADVFPADTRLIVSTRVRELLERVYGGSYLPCELERCFDYPFQPGDCSFENDPCFRLAPPDDATAIVLKFAERYQCACPQVPLCELIPHRLMDVTGRVNGRWKDSVSVILSDPDNGLQRVEARVSPSMIDEFGVIWDYGFWCRDDVFEVLDPWLQRPFFWAGQVPV